MRIKFQRHWNRLAPCGHFQKLGVEIVHGIKVSLFSDYQQSATAEIGVPATFSGHGQHFRN